MSHPERRGRSESATWEQPLSFSPELPAAGSKAPILHHAITELGGSEASEKSSAGQPNPTRCVRTARKPATLHEETETPEPPGKEPSGIRRFANSTCLVCAHPSPCILLELARSDLYISTPFADEWPAIGQQLLGSENPLNNPTIPGEHARRNGNDEHIGVQLCAQPRVRLNRIGIAARRTGKEPSVDRSPRQN
jgi:hypothetical protein